MNLNVVMRGFLIPLILQAVVIAISAWVGNNRRWNIEPVQVAAFVIATSIGFVSLTRHTSAQEKVLIALGYVPLMAILAWVIDLVLLFSIPGAQGNF